MSERLTALLLEQLDDILNDPNLEARAYREAGFWRGAVRGLVRNYGDDPVFVVDVLAACVTHTEEAK